MKSTIGAVILLALTFVLIAAQATLRTADVEGVVRNLKTSEPLVDVRVTLTPEITPGVPLTAVAPTSSKTATTDAEGKFTIAGINAGRYTISATRTLFFRPKRDAGPVTLSISEGQRLSGVQILLSPTAVIAGRVIDERREPLRSIRVEAVRREFRDGLRQWTNAGTSTTDDRGEYRLFNLPPGTYFIRATQSTGSTALYYPGVPDSSSAVPVSVDVGNEAGAIDIEMRRIPEYSVQLKLGGIPPGSTANFLIRRRTGLANEQLLARPETLPDNTYKLGQMPQGVYDVMVQVFTPTTVQPRTLTHAANIPITVTNTNLDLGTVAIPATLSVSGRIVVPDPLPSPLIPAGLILTMRALDLTLPITAAVRGSATTQGFNPDGTFTISNVVPGRYQLALTGLPPDTFLVSAKEGTREVLDTGFTVNGTQSLLELTVAGPGAVASVVGTVVNALGQPVPSSTVALIPAPERRSNPAAFRVTNSDQSGNFTMRSVMAGDYRVLAWEEIEAGAHMDPEFLKIYETRGENVRVQRGSQNSVTVRIIPGQ